MLYFAYGSNMSIKRLTQPTRVPSARKICVGTLPCHRLIFHKKSKDGSAKCDAFHSRIDGDSVQGVLFEIPESEKKQLDRAEGLGFGYEEKCITVSTETGERKAIIYLATEIDHNLKPYSWYKDHVLIGAKENNLPPDYISSIEKIEAMPDQDKKRETEELKIYR